MKFEIQDIPMRMSPDWNAIAGIVKRDGFFLAPPSLDANVANGVLHRLGIRAYPVRVAGQLVAYSIEPNRNKKLAEAGGVAEPRVGSQP